MRRQFKLLVCSDTSAEWIEQYKAIIVNKNPGAQLALEDVVVVVWSGEPLKNFLDNRTRLYAAPAIGEQLTAISEIRYWAERFFMLKKWTPPRYGMPPLSTKRVAPLLVCKDGAPGLDDL